MDLTLRGILNGGPAEIVLILRVSPLYALRQSHQTAFTTHWVIAFSRISTRLLQLGKAHQIGCGVGGKRKWTGCSTS
jgi:hypothetical protein